MSNMKIILSMVLSPVTFFINQTFHYSLDYCCLHLSSLLSSSGVEWTGVAGGGLGGPGTAAPAQPDPGGVWP